MGKEFYIEEFSDRYRIYNVNYRGEFYIFDWTKELLEGGNLNFQEAWIKRTLDSDWQKENGLWRIAPLTAYHSTFVALYNNKDHPNNTQKTLIEKVKKIFISNDFVLREHFMTSSRAKYVLTPKSIPNNLVTHNWGYDDVYTLEGNFYLHYFAHRYIRDDTCKKEANVFFGSENIQELIKANNWIHENKTDIPVLFRYTTDFSHRRKDGRITLPSSSSRGTIFIWHAEVPGYAHGWFAIPTKNFLKK